MDSSKVCGQWTYNEQDLPADVVPPFGKGREKAKYSRTLTICQPIAQYGNERTTGPEAAPSSRERIGRGDGGSGGGADAAERSSRRFTNR